MHKLSFSHFLSTASFFPVFFAIIFVRDQIMGIQRSGRPLLEQSEMTGIIKSHGGHFKGMTA